MNYLLLSLLLARSDSDELQISPFRTRFGFSRTENSVHVVITIHHSSRTADGKIFEGQQTIIAPGYRSLIRLQSPRLFAIAFFVNILLNWSPTIRYVQLKKLGFGQVYTDFEIPPVFMPLLYKSSHRSMYVQTSSQHSPLTAINSIFPAQLMLFLECWYYSGLRGLIPRIAITRIVSI